MVQQKAAVYDTLKCMASLRLCEIKFTPYLS